MNRVPFCRISVVLTLLVILACNLPFNISIIPGEEGTTPAAPENVEAGGVEQEFNLPAAVPAGSFTALSSAEIGANGGRLEAQGFVLQIPAGAFSADAQLSLSVSSDATPFGDSAASPAYRVDGLPPEISQPLTVRIQVAEQLSGESYIAIGMPAISPDTLSTDYAYIMLPAMQNGDYLESSLAGTPAARLGAGQDKMAAPIPGAGKDAASQGGLFPKTVTAQAAKGYVNFESKNKFFIIRGPQGLAFAANALLEELENLKGQFEGLNLNLTQKMTWPLPGLILPLNSEKAVVYMTLSDGRSVLLFNTSKVVGVSMDEIRPDLVRALFWVIPKVFDREWEKPSHYWFHLAIDFMAAGLVSENPLSYIPPEFKGYEYIPLRGLRWQRNDLTLSVRQGHGMTSLARYFVDYFNPKDVLTIYRNLEAQSNGSPPAPLLKVLLESLPKPASEWWPDFIDRYVSGQVNEVKVTTLLQYVEASFRLSSPGNITQTFPVYNPDLSARLYQISFAQLPADEVPDRVSLQLSLSTSDTPPPNLKMIVYRWRPEGETIKKLKEGTDLSIGGIKEMVTMPGWGLLVAVINSTYDPQHTGDDTTNAELKIEVMGFDQPAEGAQAPTMELPTSPPPAPVKPPEALDFNYVDLRIHVPANMTQTNPAHTVTYEGEIPSIWKEVTGTFKGGEFTASWDEKDSTTHKTGSIRITVDTENLKILSVSFDETEDSKGTTLDGNTQTSTSHETVSLNLSILKVSTEGLHNYLYMNAYPLNMCDLSPSVSFSEEWTNTDPGEWPTGSRKFNSVTCNPVEGSVYSGSVYIELKKTKQ